MGRVSKPRGMAGADEPCSRAGGICAAFLIASSGRRRALSRAQIIGLQALCLLRFRRADVAVQKLGQTFGKVSIRDDDVLESELLAHGQQFQVYDAHDDLLEFHRPRDHRRQNVGVVVVGQTEQDDRSLSDSR